MKIKKENIQVVMEAPDTIMRTQEGLGGFTVAYHELPKGTDFTPLLKGLANDSCHSPHWGYVFEGAVRVIYDDGNQELIKAGDAFYMPPGHTAIVEDDIKLFDFSPTKEINEVFENVQKRMAEIS